MVCKWHASGGMETCFALMVSDLFGQCLEQEVTEPEDSGAEAGQLCDVILPFYRLCPHI